MHVLSRQRHLTPTRSRVQALGVDASAATIAAAAGKARARPQPRVPPCTLGAAATRRAKSARAARAQPGAARERLQG